MRETRCGLDVTVGVLGQLVSYLRARGVDVDAVFRSAGADVRVLDDPDARLPLETYLDIEDLAALAAGDPLLGLHMGECHQDDHWSVAGWYMARCATLGEVFTKGNRYSRIVGNLISSRAWLIPRGIRVQFSVPRQAPAMSRHCFEAMLSSSMTMARRLSGQALAPLAIRLTTPSPDNDSEYLRVFGCPVQFDCKACGMDIPFDWLKIPVLAPDPALEQRFAAWAEERLASLPNLALTSAQVSRLIIQGLDDPKLSLRSVARELAMSPRSLQAQLAAEGSEFSLLLRQAREQLARQYLKENHTVEDITCWLGFAEPSVFRKAFKKWSGMTPAEYRRIG